MGETIILYLEEGDVKKIIENIRETGGGCIYPAPNRNDGQFKKFLTDMLDLDNENLNIEEIRLRDRIRKWRDQARRNPEQYKFDINYLKQNSELPEPVNLNELTNRYNDTIKQKTGKGVFDEELRYNEVNLIVRFELDGRY